MAQERSPRPHRSSSPPPRHRPVAGQGSTLRSGDGRSDRRTSRLWPEDAIANDGRPHTLAHLHEPRSLDQLRQVHGSVRCSTPDDVPHFSVPQVRGHRRLPSDRRARASTRSSSRDLPAPPGDDLVKRGEEIRNGATGECRENAPYRTGRILVFALSPAGPVRAAGTGSQVLRGLCHRLCRTGCGEWGRRLRRGLRRSSPFE